MKRGIENMNFLNLYEIQCLDYANNWIGYFYVHSFKTLRHKKDSIKNGYVPNGLRFIINDQYWAPTKVTPLNPFVYFWKKYIKKYFYFGWRVNWEKELKKIKKTLDKQKNL